MGGSIAAQLSTGMSAALMERDAARAANVIPAVAGDGSLFPIDKMEAHRSGVLHQAVSVFVFSGNEMLVQRRAAGKYHCGRQWANTCCTHPFWGETPAEAAQRRTFEELGFSVPLVPARVITYSTPVGNSLFEHERVQLYCATADKKHLRIAANADEVMETRWATREKLQTEIRAQPQSFAPWFRIYLKRWNELGLQ
jgi:isopentenyl-diphosphate delta-isomerase